MPETFNIAWLEFTWLDVLDVLLVAALLFQIYRLLRGTIGSRILVGAILFYVVYWAVRIANLPLLRSIFEQIMAVGVLAAIIIFQPEIRKFLLSMGKTPSWQRAGWFKQLFNRKPPQEPTFNLSPVIEATKVMSGNHTGAIIAFAKSSELKFYAESGDPLDAIVTKRLLLSIFFKNSPMHDGAVIIAHGRVKAARCILPVSDSSRLPARYGLRHRAALGLSEVTDSVVLVVSEETGQLSLAYNGQLEHNLSPAEVRAKLNQYLHELTIRHPDSRIPQEVNPTATPVDPLVVDNM